MMKAIAGFLHKKMIYASITVAPYLQQGKPEAGVWDGGGERYNTALSLDKIGTR